MENRTTIDDTIIGSLPLPPDVVVVCREASDLAVHNAETARAADLVIARLKQGEKGLEQEKELRCRRLLSELEEVRRPYLQAIDFLRSIRRVMDNRLGEYRAILERQRQQAQQRIIEEHRKVQQELEAKAAAARQAIEAARQTADASRVARAEAKLETLDLQRQALPGPRVLPPLAAPTVLEDGTTQSQRAIKRPSLPGCDLAKKVSAADAAFNGFDFLAWRHLFIVDLSALNAELKSRGTLPAPFLIVTEYSSTLRKGQG